MAKNSRSAEKLAADHSLDEIERLALECGRKYWRAVKQFFFWAAIAVINLIAAWRLAAAQPWTALALSSCGLLIVLLASFQVGKINSELRDIADALLIKAAEPESKDSKN